MKKKLPIGIDDFEKIISQDYYYVDKSLLIKELLDAGTLVTLIPRPRRFGKTLNLSMLRYFFEKVTQGSHASLFENLAIAQHPECMIRQGQYPVIFLTLKFADKSTWDKCFDVLKRVISDEFNRHSYLLKSSILKEHQKREFEAIIDLSASEVAYTVSLKNLTSYLAAYHKKKPILLIDEYDVPIHASFYYKYYEQVIEFMKGFLGDGLKGNINLEWAVVTGILRIAKESVFTGLNNLGAYTIIDNRYADKFGLFEAEVGQLLRYYQLNEKIDDVRLWYNGYTSGSHTMYNPWSILNFADNQGELKPYWINTSSNSIIKDLIKWSNESVKEDIELLLQGKNIRKRINENIIFADVYKKDTALWSFLLFSGYLTFKNKSTPETLLPEEELGCTYADLLIPNIEVRTVYKDTITNWFAQEDTHSYNLMLASLVHGDVPTFKELFTHFVLTSFSSFDVSGSKPEKFYHAFVLGMLVHLAKNYEVKSNRESGYGRYDVLIVPHDKNKIGIVIEFKKVSSYRKETLQQAVTSALKQIEEKKYAVELVSRGCSTIIKLGIVFDGKMVLIEQG